MTDRLREPCALAQGSTPTSLRRPLSLGPPAIRRMADSGRPSLPATIATSTTMR